MVDDAVFPPVSNADGRDSSVRSGARLDSVNLLMAGRARWRRLVSVDGFERVAGAAVGADRLGDGGKHGRGGMTRPTRARRSRSARCGSQGRDGVPELGAAGSGGRWVHQYYRRWLSRAVVRVFSRVPVASALTQTEGSGSLLSLSKMALAGLVQTNGFGSPLCSRM
jgi:hypothetical protein